jgi:hypothetical protein
VEIDDAYLGGERTGAKRGRGAPGKTPFVAAVETTPEGKPVRLKLRRVASFCNHARLLLGSGVVGLGAWVASVEGIWCDGGSAGPTGSREEFPPSWLHWTCSTSPA